MFEPFSADTTSRRPVVAVHAVSGLQITAMLLPTLRSYLCRGDSKAVRYSPSVIKGKQTWVAVGSPSSLAANR